MDDLCKCIDKLYGKGDLKVHFTQIDYEDENYKYNTLCGVYLNGELKESFELDNISNKEIEDLKERINTLISSKTLYLI